MGAALEKSLMGSEPLALTPKASSLSWGRMGLMAIVLGGPVSSVTVCLLKDRLHIRPEGEWITGIMPLLTAHLVRILPEVA